MDDVFVRDSRPAYVYDNTNLAVAYGDINNERISFVKFPIPFNVRNAALINDASVHLRINQAPTENMTIIVCHCDTEDWVEETTTWNTQPTYDNSSEAIMTSFTLTSAHGGTWVNINVKDAILNSVQDQNVSLSLVLQAERQPGLASQIMKFDSKEDFIYVPQLSVDYIPGSHPQLVSEGADGSLEYVPYGNQINYVNGSSANPTAVNTIPDFSNVGFKGGGVPIPFVPAVKIINESLSLQDDCREEIQQVIDEVADMSLDANGFRGAILFPAGEY
eukprot:scaffold1270_cov252-Amphora_coffeaeformis.AAC.7